MKSCFYFVALASSQGVGGPYGGLEGYSDQGGVTFDYEDFVPDLDLSCFHCDAKNMTHCLDIGESKPCAKNAQTCMIEVRKRNGILEGVL